MKFDYQKGQTYRTEDYLAVLPTNLIETVSRVLKRFNLFSDTQIKIVSSTNTFFPTNNLVSAFHVLSGHVELTQSIRIKQIETLAGLYKNEKEQISLKDLVRDEYEKEIVNKRISILDIIIHVNFHLQNIFECFHHFVFVSILFHLHLYGIQKL